MMPMGDSIPSCLSFEDFLVTLRVLESSGESMPDAFLAFLRGKVVYSTEYSLTISGDSITDSVVLLCARTFDTLKPLPGSSKDGDSIIPLICNLVGVSASSLPSVVGSGAGCSTGVSIPCLLSPPPGFACLPSVLLLLPLLLLCRLLLSFLFFLVLFFLLVFRLHRPPLLFLPFPCRYSCHPSCCSCCFPSFSSSFIHSSALPTRSSRSSLPSLSATWSLLSFRSFCGLFFLFFGFFSPFFGSSCFFLLFPFSSLVICRFFPSSFWSFLCPSCRLFRLFGSYSLVVSPFVCLRLLLLLC